MKVCDILEDLGNSSTPVQPDINHRDLSYEECLLQWNLLGIKKNALFYQFKTGSDPEKCQHTLFPDACLNILFDCDNNVQSFISGTFLTPKILELLPNTQYFGFKPYSTLGLKAPDFNLRELVGDFTKLSDVYPHLNDLAYALSSCDTFDERINSFNSIAKDALIDYDHIPSFIDYFTMMISSSKGNIRFNNIEKITGYSERYCREIFKNYHGLSPKQYCSIIRFQNAVRDLLSSKYDDLSGLAHDNGYFDQAHFIRDFKKYTETSPKKFLSQVAS